MKHDCPVQVSLALVFQHEQGRVPEILCDNRLIVRPGCGHPEGHESGEEVIFCEGLDYCIRRKRGVSELRERAQSLSAAQFGHRPPYLTASSVPA